MADPHADAAETGGEFGDTVEEVAAEPDHGRIHGDRAGARLGARGRAAGEAVGGGGALDQLGVGKAAGGPGAGRPGAGRHRR